VEHSPYVVKISVVETSENAPIAAIDSHLLFCPMRFLLPAGLLFYKRRMGGGQIIERARFGARKGEGQMTAICGR
jgi:hypothetical protein